MLILYGFSLFAWASATETWRAPPASIGLFLNLSTLRQEADGHLHGVDAGGRSACGEAPRMDSRLSGETEGRRVVRGVVSDEDGTALRQVAEIAVWATMEGHLLGEAVPAEIGARRGDGEWVAPPSCTLVGTGAKEVSLGYKASERAAVLEIVLAQSIARKITGS